MKRVLVAFLAAVLGLCIGAVIFGLLIRIVLWVVFL